jgi:prepilin-type N-terminal cleavage/methylation domain-containing protein
MHATIRRAFTLIELLVVMIIIAVIIAIVLPAVGGVRNTARKQGTATLLNNVAQASQQFYNDSRRMPGMFSEKQMGSTGNDTAGMSGTENILLDLIGAETVRGDQPNPAGGATWVEVGPTPGSNQAQNLKVNMDTFGAGTGTKNYFTPDAKLYVAQIRPSQMAGPNGNAGASENDPQLKDLVDYWGQPVLAWRQDDTAIGPVTQISNFAAADSSAQAPSRFYWNSNAAFLKSTSLGRRGRPQDDANVGSMLFDANNANKAQALAAFLGHPSYPYRPTGGGVPTVPASARGKLVLHSAGADGVYLARNDAGAKQFVNGLMNYAVNFVPDPSQPQSASNRYETEDGKADSIDLLKRFDDLAEGTGN